MSGTDHAKAADWAGPTPTVILVEPQMGENIGAAARAMWNFGLDRMRIINPRDGWPNPKAQAMASGAGRVMDAVQVHERTETALEDLNFTFATTARSRDLTKLVVTPERAMEMTHSMIAEGQKVGVMFGPERSGLANEDIVQANALISVPVNPAFASLNLAQCVLLLAYEWRRLAGTDAPSFMEMAGTDFASGLEVQKLGERMEEALGARGFFWPEDKAESMILTLRNMLSRLNMTQADIRVFHGIIKTMEKPRR
ncbi:tRNA (cytidine/uridine-2'-O-)-methyltransferase TrmJ [Amylibacter marinus]|uniref:tRNA (cytidine/uridine-2'-O-)-methyltransferase TrmJ n=1 Tax=Amylibacter marinus TaxID=1475483 RepID=A0ABQ5VT00_9RHOB|nr:RNA methyltransferase [Amylibacter marinus]GLQ34406.1 tRNA (cytidine/uridine-2'-O-)-methyltransferase TrmJ [Amylibacter marinus]